MFVVEENALYRVKAGLIHLLGSCLLAALAVTLVFRVWYPAPLSDAVGVTSIFLLILGVDVVLGPLLTTIVYRPGKPSLRFDLACIVVVQMIAFGYGLWTVSQGRPAWLVYNANRFDLVQAYELDTRKLEAVPDAYRSAPWWGARWVAAEIPKDLQQRSDLTLEAVFAGLDVPQRPNLYRPLESFADDLRKHAQPLAELDKLNDPASVKEWLQANPQADAWLPMMARIQPMVVLINKAQARVVAVVPLKPWS